MILCPARRSSCFRPMFAVYSMLAMLLLLSGCVHQTTHQPVPDWETHQTRVQQLSHWQITGKLGVRVPGDNGSANLRWENQAQNFRLDLSGPFGQGRLLITGKPGKVTLQQPGDAPLIADSAASLIYQATGWTLPVELLTFWVRGIPAPQQPVSWIEKNDAGLVAALKQDGWHIHYSQYQRVKLDGTTYVQLPGKILAEYQDIRLTLIIRQWTLTH